MTYVEGFVTPVPTANREAYLRYAEEAAAVLKDLGVARFVECWGDWVPEGELTDFQGAVQARADETVLFSWFEFPSRAVRDAVHQKMMSDPRLTGMMDTMPFDARRMIFGGFEVVVEEGEGGRPAYVNGMLVAVPAARKAEFVETSRQIARIFREHGALRSIDAWGDDVPDGKLTDYRRAVKASDDEIVVYSFVEWDSKETHDAAWEKIMADPRMPQEMPFDGKRMIYGGFRPLLDI